MVLLQVDRGSSVSGGLLLVASNHASSSSSITRGVVGIELQTTFSAGDDKNGTINTSTTTTTTTSKKKVGTIHIAAHREEPETPAPSTTQDDEDDDNDDNDDDDEDEEQVELIPCPVILESFQSLSPQRQAQWRDKVQSFHFTDFEGLHEFMLPLKDQILKRHPPTLRLVHEQFQNILQEIIVERKVFCNSLLDGGGGGGAAAASTTTTTTTILVAPFATPNVRLKRGTYATFLHADAVFGAAASTALAGEAAERRGTTATASANKPQAMINVWMSLTDTPICNFPLCFHECSRTNTRFAENKLYYHADDDDDTTDIRMLHDPTITWGSFLCFVAGQPVSSDRVVLHGAVRLEDHDHDHDHDDSSSSSSRPNGPNNNEEEFQITEARTTRRPPSAGPGRRRSRGDKNDHSRKSLEMRYLL
jgi:hypothetical protein